MQTIEEETGGKHVEIQRTQADEGRTLDKASFMSVRRHHAAAVLWVGTD